MKTDLFQSCGHCWVLQEGIRGQTRWNHTHRNLVNLITLGPQPCLTQWNQAMPAGQPKTGGSWWRGLTECGPLEKEMASHFSILALRTPWTVWKGKNDRIPKEELSRSLGAQYATGDQWRNNSRKNEGMESKQKQYAVVDVTGDRSKIRCCKEHRNLECQVHESRQIGSGQTGDGKSERWHSRNQWIKMDWNGWI